MSEPVEEMVISPEVKTSATPTKDQVIENGEAAMDDTVTTESKRVTQESEQLESQTEPQKGNMKEAMEVEPRKVVVVDPTAVCYSCGDCKELARTAWR